MPSKKGNVGNYPTILTKYRKIRAGHSLLTACKIQWCFCEYKTMYGNIKNTPRV